MARRLKDITIISDAGGSAVFAAKESVIYKADKVDEHVEGFMIAASEKLAELKELDPSLGINFVVTSILDEGGRTHKGKAHGKGLAIDLQIPEEYRFNGRAHESPIWKFWNTGDGRKLREDWGMNMITPYHGSAAHLHIEYDPTGKKKAGNIVGDEYFTKEVIEEFFEESGRGKIDPKATDLASITKRALGNPANLLPKKGGTPENVTTTDESITATDISVAPVTFTEAPEVVRSFVYDVKNEQQEEEKAQEKKEVSDAEKELVETENVRTKMLQELQLMSELEDELASNIGQRGAEYIENPYLSQNQLIPDEFIFEDGGTVNGSEGDAKKAKSDSIKMFPIPVNVDKLYRSVTPIAYDATQAGKEYVVGRKLPFTWDGVETSWEDFQNHPMFKDNPEYGQYVKDASNAAWKGYIYGMDMDDPEISSVYSRSKYKPSKAKDKDAKYYSLNNIDDVFEDAVTNKLTDKSTKVGTKKQIKDSGAGGFTLSNYTLSKGKDDKGSYISYYDKNDYNINVGVGTVKGENIVGNPFEVYGRIYYDPETLQVLDDDRMDLMMRNIPREDGGTIYRDGGEVGDKIKKLREEGYPQDQAVAIALNMKEKGYYEDGDEVELTDQEIAILLANGYTIEGLE